MALDPPCGLICDRCWCGIFVTCFAAQLLLVARLVGSERMGTVGGYEVLKCLRRIGYSLRLGWNRRYWRFKHSAGLLQPLQDGLAAHIIARRLKCSVTIL